MPWFSSHFLYRDGGEARRGNLSSDGNARVSRHLHLCKHARWHFHLARPDANLIFHRRVQNRTHHEITSASAPFGPSIFPSLPSHLSCKWPHGVNNRRLFPRSPHMPFTVDSAVVSLRSYTTFDSTSVFMSPCGPNGSLHTDITFFFVCVRRGPTNTTSISKKKLRFSTFV